MVNIIKRVLSMVLVTSLFAVASSGCGKELRTLPCFSDDTYYPQYSEYSELDMSWTQNAQKVEAKVQTEVNELCADLSTYLNSDLKANWKSKDIEVYVTNVTENVAKYTTVLTYGACYYKNKIFIDEAFLVDELNSQNEYILAHELIHYLYELNNGNSFFALYMGGLGEYCCGMYLNEGIVDALARRYIIQKYPKMREENDGSGYRYLRLLVDLRQIEIPNLFEYFFQNDIEGMKEAVDKQAQKYILSEGSSFEKFCSLIDPIILEKDINGFSLLISFLIQTTSKENADQVFERIQEYNLEIDMDYLEIKELMY